MRFVRMIMAIAVLAGTTAAADAKGGGPANNAPKPSIRASDTVPDHSNRPNKNRHKGPKGSVCANGSNAKPANCAAPVSPQ